MRSKSSVPRSLGALFSLTIPCLISLCLFLAFPKAAWPHTWHVKNDLTGDWETIQIAIDYSTSGDTILVGPGTYNENLIIDGKELVLKSDSGPESTILDGSLSPTSVIFCTGGLTNDTVIEGFTITGGRGSTPPFQRFSHWGGGIFCLEAAPTIRGNVISANQADDLPPNPLGSSRGGGISFAVQNQALPPILIEGNIIEENFAIANGGGIDINSRCEIRNNVIRGNRTGHGDGAGLYYISGSAPLVIEHNLIVANVSADHGGGIHIAATSPTSPPPGDFRIVRNIVIGNEAHEPIATDGAGGGLWLWGGAYVFQNTIAFNFAESGQAPPAGGVCILFPRFGTLLENNIIQGNSEGGIVALDGNLFGAVLVEHNLIHQNGVQDIYSSTLLVEIENLFQDARFCVEGEQSEGDLAENSPALSSSFGVIGALSDPACGPVVGTKSATWGRIKMLFDKRSLTLGREGRKRAGQKP